MFFFRIDLFFRFFIIKLKEKKGVKIIVVGIILKEDMSFYV